uniref:SEC16 homolog B, endoplasmic reticulum export factor n=1 Tax=Felis catus TaxID=9685 RepID=A0ABI7WML1_FELCA
MEFWAPQWPPQPWGRPTAPSKDPDRGLQRDGNHRPVPCSWYNGERYHQWQDTHRSPQPQQDPRTDHQQPHYASRPGERRQPVLGVDYYEGGYPRQLYSRPGIEDPYQSYHSPTLREEYAYGDYYYHRPPQQLQEERVPRRESPYMWQEDHRDQKYLSEHHHENQNSLSKSRNSHKDSPASNTRPERPGDLFPESLLTGTQKNEPSLANESSLLRQHESGLSSSAYELSQYMGADSEPYDPVASAAWSPIQAGGYCHDLSNWLSLVRRGLGDNLLESHPSPVLPRVDCGCPVYLCSFSWAERPLWLHFSPFLLYWRLHHS